MRKAALVIGLTGLIVVLGLLGARYAGLLTETGNPESIADRQFVSPQLRRVTSNVLATGSIRLRVGAEVRVGSQLSGIVKKLNVTVGSHIERGDVIALIDSRGLEARLAQARAEVKVIEQELRRARVELARSQRLAQDKLAPRSDVEDRELALKETEARLEKARRDVAVVETDLTYAVISAPISGTIASVSTQEGETVAAAFTTPTFVTITEDGALELVALVDETDIGGVVTGNPVTFTVEAFPAREFEGHVTQIAPKGTIISGVVNFEVMIDIDSPLDGLRPDMTANVSIRTAEREALVLPSQAVQREDFDRFVYVEKDGRLEKRSVSVGSQQAGFIEIRQGVSLDDHVLLGPPPAQASAG